MEEIDENSINSNSGDVLFQNEQDYEEIVPQSFCQTSIKTEPSEVENEYDSDNLMRNINGNIEIQENIDDIKVKSEPYNENDESSLDAISEIKSENGESLNENELKDDVKLEPTDHYIDPLDVDVPYSQFDDINTNFSISSQTKYLLASKSNNQCVECNAFFGNMRTLKYHMKTFHEGIKEIPCDQCGKQFLDPGKLKRHVWKFHYKKFQCDFCEKSFRLSKSLEEHVKIAHEGMKFEIKCDNCDKVFESSKCLKKHTRRFHGKIKGKKEGKNPTSRKCDQCDKTFKSFSGLKDHKKVEHEGLKFECHLCDKVFSWSKNLGYHIKTVHEGIKLEIKCDQCDKVFESNSGLKYHIKTGMN